jgi:DNA end-binding protein Ku
MAMRAIWKGSISLGLVGVPVKLYSATEEKDIRFHQVHAADGGRVQMKRVCTVEGVEVPYAEIGKGIDATGQGDLVILTDEDFAEVPVPTAKAITVLQFVPAGQVDPIMFQKAYYLAPDGVSAQKPYLLLREALLKSDRVGIVKIALRQREHLATLRVRDDTLTLSMMLWPDEIREPDFEFLSKKTTLRPPEKAMAATLVETMAGDFDPAEHTDNYREAVIELVEAKLSGEPLPEVKPEKPTKATDLLAVLTASVEAAKTGRKKPPATKAPAGKKAPAGRKAAPAAKAPAKKTAKKTATKAASAAKKTADKAAAKKAPAAKKAAPRKRAA